MTSTTPDTASTSGFPGPPRQRMNSGVKWLVILAAGLAVAAILWFFVFPQIAENLPAQF